MNKRMMIAMIAVVVGVIASCIGTLGRLWRGEIMSSATEFSILSQVNSGV